MCQSLREPRLSIELQKSPQMPLSSEATIWRPSLQQCRQLTSNGLMLSGFVAKVVKTDGTLAVAGDTGEAVMARPSVVLGYVGDEVA
ncbi:uncharacterized protein ARMOST_01443 [Armillaria ostoyae]|uniref:AMP-dependent synthetase/ligase domain-containing protein n=1 Tax=Armillaria ostoyae TaxID=47428 RepID=A0A284QNX4_ARMOS|nr:uncharacterized protein ARMOST_01443 [Armillaria ostoyae]